MADILLTVDEKSYLKDMETKVSKYFDMEMVNKNYLMTQRVSLGISLGMLVYALIIFLTVKENNYMIYFLFWAIWSTYSSWKHY